LLPSSKIDLLRKEDFAKTIHTKMLQKRIINRNQHFTAFLKKYMITTSTKTS